MMMMTMTDADDYVNDSSDDDNADHNDDDDDDDNDAYDLVLVQLGKWPWRLHLVSTKHLLFSFFNS